MGKSAARNDALLGEENSTDCPGRTIVDHVVSKWGMLVMIALSERAYRYAELRRRVGGVSERMLALTLRTLDGDGLVARRDFREVPPRVEYELTPLGRSLAQHLLALGAWITTNTPKVLAARAAASAARARQAGSRAEARGAERAPSPPALRSRASKRSPTRRHGGD